MIPSRENKASAKPSGTIDRMYTAFTVLPRIADEIAAFAGWLKLQRGKVNKTVSAATVSKYADYTRMLLVEAKDAPLTYESVKEIATRLVDQRGNKNSTWNTWVSAVRAYDRYCQTRCKRHRVMAINGRGWHPIECKGGGHGFSLLMAQVALTDTQHHKKVSRPTLDAYIEVAQRRGDDVMKRFWLTAWNTMARGGEQITQVEVSAAELLRLRVKDFDFDGPFEYEGAEGEVLLRYGGKTGKGQKAWFWYPGDAALVKASFEKAGLTADDYAFPGQPSTALKLKALFRGYLRYHTVRNRMFVYGAKIGEYTVHGIRGGAANYLDQAGVPLADIMTLGRWKDPVTLRNYLESSREGMANSLQKARAKALATAPVVVEQVVPKAAARSEQNIVSKDEAKALLKTGWRIVSIFPDGEVLVERAERILGA